MDEGNDLHDKKKKQAINPNAENNKVPVMDSRPWEG